MVRRGCERGIKVTSGASIEFKRKRISRDPNIDLRRVPRGKAQEGPGGIGEQ